MNMEKFKISCISRIYLIKCGNMEIEIESPKPLEGKDIQTVLEKDALLEIPLKELLSNYKIVNRYVNVENLKKGKSKKERQKKQDKEKKERQKKQDKERHVRHMRVILEKGFTPKQRIVIMSNMEGLFSRLDYHEYIEKKCKIKMSKFMSHGDIEQAIIDRIIEPTGQKVMNPISGRRVPTYRIIKKLPIDEYISKKIEDKEKIVQ